MAKKAKKSKKSAPKKIAKKAAKKTTKAAAKKAGSKKKTGRAQAQSWSEKDVERLKKLITQNTPTPLIASKLNRSLHRLGVMCSGMAFRSDRPTEARPTELVGWSSVVSIGDQCQTEGWPSNARPEES